MKSDPESLLLILPLTVHQSGGRVFIEPQAANGLYQWAKHFSTVTVGLKLVPGEPPASSLAIDELPLNGRLKVELFPPAWTPASFAKSYRGERAKLAGLIDRHAYLHFAIGGAWGDWGAIGGLEASKKRRKFSVWTDRVESVAMHQEARKVAGIRRAVRSSYARVAEWLERRVIRRASVGLFHGMNTYDGYKRFCRNPQLVHDIHLKPSDAISAERLAAKVKTSTNGPLDIIYVGRIHPDKAPLEWIEALRIAADAGTDFRATWFGHGPMESEAKSLVETLGMSSKIQFPGNIDDRAELLEHLRAAHIMVFCHVTPESPRCLIEALASGTPIVGYKSPYAADLISANGGGALSEMNPKALADVIIRVANGRASLPALINAAAGDGAHFNDEYVFAHRAALMKQYS